MESSDDETPLMDLTNKRKRVRIPRRGSPSINSACFCLKDLTTGVLPVFQPRADKNHESAPIRHKFRPSPETVNNMTAAQHKAAYVQKLQDEHAKLDVRLCATPQPTLPPNTNS